MDYIVVIYIVCMGITVVNSYIDVIKSNRKSHHETCKKDMLIVAISSIFWPVVFLAHFIEWFENNFYKIHLSLYNFFEKKIKKD